jgi:hypothetical protein
MNCTLNRLSREIGIPQPKNSERSRGQQGSALSVTAIAEELGALDRRTSENHMSENAVKCRSMLV